MSKILIINGPNLNLLGEREQSQYGKEDYKFLEEICIKRSKELEIELEIQQSNLEGEIVTKIQNSRKEYDGIIINAAGYTHTSVSILDALLIIKIPIIELHISNIYARENFRHKSLISRAAKGIICGFGIDGYLMSLDAIKKMFGKK